MTSKKSQHQLCRVAVNGSSLTVHLQGNWRLNQLNPLSGALKLPDLNKLSGRQWMIDGSRLESIDTAASLLLYRRLQAAGVSPDDIELTGFSASHERIISGVLKRLPQTQQLPAAPKRGWVAAIGKAAESAGTQFLSHLSFLGMAIAALAQVIDRKSVV